MIVTDLRRKHNVQGRFLSWKHAGETSSSFLLLPSSSSLVVGPLKPATRSGGAGPGAEPRTKTNWVHSKAVRKPLVAIILNKLILTSILYRCHLSRVQWRRRSVAQGGWVGAGSAYP